MISSTINGLGDASFSCSATTCTPNTSAEKNLFSTLQDLGNKIAAAAGLPDGVRVAVNGAIGAGTIKLVQAIAAIALNYKIDPTLALLDDATGPFIAANAASIVNSFRELFAVLPPQPLIVPSPTSPSPTPANTPASSQGPDIITALWAAGGLAVAGGLLYIFKNKRKAQSLSGRRRR